MSWRDGSVATGLLSLLGRGVDSGRSGRVTVGRRERRRQGRRRFRIRRGRFIDSREAVACDGRIYWLHRNRSNRGGKRLLVAFLVLASGLYLEIKFIGIGIIWSSPSGTTTRPGSIGAGRVCIGTIRVWLIRRSRSIGSHGTRVGCRLSRKWLEGVGCRCEMATNCGWTWRVGG